MWVCKDKHGWHVADEFQESRLENESIRGPLHWWEAYEVTTAKSGTGKIWLAIAGPYRVKYYATAGGSCAEEHIHGIGWVIWDEMPEELFQPLLMAAKCFENPHAGVGKGGA